MITRRQGWILLGADPTYEPTRPDQPANPAQLVALNLRGLLVASVLPDGADPPEDSTRPSASASATERLQKESPHGGGLSAKPGSSSSSG